MALPFRRTLSTLGLVTLFTIVTGCSAPSSSVAPSVSPPNDSFATAAAIPSPATVTPATGWRPGVQSQVTLPEKWDGGAGIVDTKASKAFSFKNGIAVLDNDGILSTYDKDGQLLASSSLPVELDTSSGGGASQENPSKVNAAYSGGHAYLILTQTGNAKPDPKSTVQAGGELIYTVFSTETGKRVFRGTYESDAPVSIQADGNAVSFTDTVNGMTFRKIINPQTGKIDSIQQGKDDLFWQMRVDGVDIYFDQSSVGAKPGVKSDAWNLPHASPNTTFGGLTVIAYGRYMNISVLDAAVSSKCVIIDVHTGQPVPWASKVPDQCLDWIVTDSSNQTAEQPYFGVVSTRDNNMGPATTKTYLNVSSGKTASKKPNDTFQPTFVGGDGALYGYSQAIQNVRTAASMDINSGKAQTIGTPDTGVPTAISGTGMAAFLNTASGSSQVSQTEGMVIVSASTSR